jgi:hypothetical protein
MNKIEENNILKESHCDEKRYYTNEQRILK